MIYAYARGREVPSISKGYTCENVVTLRAVKWNEITHCC